MTITYAGRFGRLLFRWKASLWKNVWKELVIFLIFYYGINMIYRFALNADQRQIFAQVALRFDHIISSDIPIAFLLGLYVVTIVKRWWEQFENIGWPDDLLFLVSAYLRGEDAEKYRIIRRNIARYAVISAVLAWRNLSSRVLKRFPSATHLVRSGLMTPSEMELYESTPAPYGRWFMPLNWIQTIIVENRNDGTLDSAQCKQIMSELHNYRKKFIRIFVCDWISIPLVYTQVATVATYGYFALCLIGRQSLMAQDYPDEPKLHKVQFYFPFHTVILFLLYMGWLKVAERLMHPFGDEDDDFELNYIIDRHLYTGYMIVDDLFNQKPSDATTSDPFSLKDPVLPHTKASAKAIDHQPGKAVSFKSLPFDEMVWKNEYFRKQSEPSEKQPMSQSSYN